MDLDMTFKQYLEENRDSLKMGVAHGSFDEAIKVVFLAGFHKGIEHAVDFVQKANTEEL